MFMLNNMGVSKNRGTPKSSNLIGFSLINHPFWGTTIFGNTHMAIEVATKRIGVKIDGCKRLTTRILFGSGCKMLRLGKNIRK